MDDKEKEAYAKKLELIYNIKEFKKTYPTIECIDVDKATPIEDLDKIYKDVCIQVKKIRDVEMVEQQTNLKTILTWKLIRFRRLKVENDDIIGNDYFLIKMLSKIMDKAGTKDDDIPYLIALFVTLLSGGSIDNYDNAFKEKVGPICIKKLTELVTYIPLMY